MIAPELTLKVRRKDLISPGDYCIVWAGPKDKVILACPFCGTVFYCPHEVVSKAPLTLNPSIVGSVRCGHHFHVANGRVIACQ